MGSPKIFRGFPFSAILCLMALGGVVGTSCFSGNSAHAADASGGGSGPGKGVLTGGTKEDASLNPSLQVIPNTKGPEKPRFTGGPISYPSSANYAPLRANASQYAGGASRFTATQRETALHEALLNRVGAHIIPPISSYSMTQGAHGSGPARASGGVNTPAGAVVTGPYYRVPASVAAAHGGLISSTRVNVPLPPRRSGVT